jgi:hypothetical protein
MSESTSLSASSSKVYPYEEVAGWDEEGDAEVETEDMILDPSRLPA